MLVKSVSRYTWRKKLTALVRITLHTFSTCLTTQEDEDIQLNGNDGNGISTSKSEMRMEDAVILTIEIGSQFNTSFFLDSGPASRTETATEPGVRPVRVVTRHGDCSQVRVTRAQVKVVGRVMIYQHICQ